MEVRVKVIRDFIFSGSIYSVGDNLIGICKDNEKYVLTKDEKGIICTINSDHFNKHMELQKDVIYCVDNQNGYCHLTIGKGYEIIEEKRTRYVIRNDHDVIVSYLKDKFVLSEEELKYTIDRYNNPNDYYQPIDVIFNISIDRLEVFNINIDPNLLGIGSIHEFLDIKPLHNIRVISKYKNPQLSKLTFDLSKNNNIHIYPTLEFKSNKTTIEFALKLQEEIDYINKYLTLKKKELKMSYIIEHQPNGKRFYFKGDEGLYKGQLVICDTQQGNVYGVIKGTEYENVNKHMSRKKCWSIK